MVEGIRVADGLGHGLGGKRDDFDLGVGKWGVLGLFCLVRGFVLLRVLSFTCVSGPPSMIGPMESSFNLPLKYFIIAKLIPVTSINIKLHFDPKESQLMLKNLLNQLAKTLNNLTFLLSELDVLAVNN